MEPTRELPESLQELLADATLRRIDEREFAIDGLTHRELSGWGWETLTYSLSVDDDEGEVQFAITQESRDSGDDCVVASTDPDDVACWIMERLSEKES